MERGRVRRSALPSLSSGGQNTIKTRRHRPDYLLVVISLVLVVIGLGVIYSIGPAMAAVHHTSSNYIIEKQLIAVGLAIVAFFIASRVPLATWRRVAKPLLVVAIIATLVALVLPVNPNYPAHRWVRLGGLSFQSVELAKFALIVWLAGMLATGGEDHLRGKKIFRSIVAVLLFAGLVVAGLQSDLGSAGVIIAMLFAMALTAGVPLKRISIILVIVALIGLIAVAAVPYRRERIETFFNSSSQNCQTQHGWQSCQAMISIGSGGLVGLGLGRSVQAYGYVPEATNDSIFAIFAEKFGFVGDMVLLAIFAMLFSRMKNIAERAPDNYSRLIVIGVLIWLSAEVLINIGGMIGVMPMKGITLPFISYGGTSMLFSGIAIGLVFQVSRTTAHSSPRIRIGKKEASHDNSVRGRRLGRPYYAAPSARR